MKVLIFVAILCLALALANAQCYPSVTTASGTHAPGTICSGQLLFEDNFDSLDQAKWKHEVSLFGGYNNEFQWYVNDRSNSFIHEGNLHLKPTFTADIFGEEFLRSGRVIIPPDQCTNSKFINSRFYSVLICEIYLKVITMAAINRPHTTTSSIQLEALKYQLLTHSTSNTGRWKFEQRILQV